MNTPEQPPKPAKLARRLGRPPVALEAKQSHVISVRLTEAEYQALIGEEADFKLSKGEILRAVWRGTPLSARARAQPTPDDRRERQALVSIAGSLNQLAKRNNAGADVQVAVMQALVAMRRIISTY